MMKEYMDLTKWYIIEFRIDKMFHSREKNELAIVEYKKDNIFIRIKNFIKNKLNFNKKNK